MTTPAKLTIVSTGDRPVTVEEARDYARLFDDSHNLTLGILIDAAIDFLETELREVLLPKRYRWTGSAEQWDAFPKWPVQQIHTLTCDGVDKLSSFSVDDSVQPHELVGTLSGTVVMEWTAGAAIIPAARKLLVLALVAEWAKDREMAANTAQLGTAFKLLLESQKSHYDAVR